MKTLYVAIDMQNDFISGALGTAEAQAITQNVVNKIAEGTAVGADIAFTLDTHGADYLSTQEGIKLPVAHCIKGEDGWNLIDALADMPGKRYEKGTFGSIALAMDAAEMGYEQIVLFGVCTDICVISNAMLLKASVPQAQIIVDAACCAGTTPQSHQRALEAMAVCQVDCINR